MDVLDYRFQLFVHLPRKFTEAKLYDLYSDSPPVRSYSQAVCANLYDIYHCCVYSEKLLMMDRGTVRNMDGTQFHPNPARKLSANLYDIYHCCVYSEKLLMMDRGTVRNMDGTQFHPNPARKLSANLYDIYHCCVQ